MSIFSHTNIFLSPGTVLLLINFFWMRLLIPGKPTAWATQNGIYAKIVEGHQTQSASSVHVISSEW